GVCHRPVSDEFHWSASRSKRWQVIAIAAIATPVVRALATTWRYEVQGREHLEAVDRGPRPPIVAFWHGRILPGMIFFRDRGIVVMTSENFDGEWIARIIGRFGFGTARGSSSRGGVKALVQLKRDLAAGRPAAFAVDGPRGPRHVAQPGAVWLARSTGSPILPFHVEADRHWTLRSWDRTQVPKPFARMRLRVGAPMFVAPERPVEDALADLQARLDRLAAGLGAPPDPLD
ncbi:MAG: lysophospholipid acyltransferase family protein, partial [Vicinamibacterales bacterium]|nr:lysophospholipid acyltransferase family protein [Vicinamibacterales bacterium]